MDRNVSMIPRISPVILSLSARRAWIEILAELEDYEIRTSLSARRAWIEIFNIRMRAHTAIVALRKESVDRNKISM